MTTALYIGLLFGVIGLSAFIKIGTIVLKSSNLRPSQHSVQQTSVQRNRNRHRNDSSSESSSTNDRQNNVELGRDHRNFGDIFFIEPNSPEAARIREQLEKDDKDLPSYDEVMRMCNLTSPTAAAAPASPTSTTATTTLTMEPTAIGIAALPVPPYSERDPNTNVDTAITMEQSPSTSRAAQVST